MGSIHARGPGVWELVFRKANKHRGYDRVHGTKSEAKKRLAELEVREERIRLNLEVPPILQTVEDAYEDHRDSLRELRSFASVDGRWRNHILPTLGRTLVHQVTPEDISKLLRAKAKAGSMRGEGGTALSPQTVRHLRIHLFRFFTWAIEEKRLFRGENPVARAWEPEVLEPEPQALELAQVEAIAAAALDTDVADLIRTAVLTGLRRGELIALIWADVDLEDRIIRVKRSGDSKTTKGGKSRPVPIPLALLPHLERRRRESRSNYVFPSPAGGMNRPDWDVNALFQTALKRAGLVDGYEHTCGTTRAPATGERHGRAKLKAAQVRDVRRRAAAGEGPTALAKAFGVSRRTIGLIIKGERWGGAAQAAGGCGHTETHPDNAARECPACKVQMQAKALPARFLFKHLRSTYLTHVVERTGDLKVSQDLGGHSDDRVTRRHYAKTKEKHLREQVDRAFASVVADEGT
ncbi:tyrosine-type recombinase/integrase [Corallococcus sp. EGB]|uniref:tyrosine-type recombinase/integrase n=1 Tax=Corallococcus sp. EGB TaxID=1521117 RepID=UPI001CC143C8|nr:tyrosine-type recombinase/integrase [Corallococcus sp. EGB]